MNVNCFKLQCGYVGEFQPINLNLRRVGGSDYSILGLHRYKTLLKVICKSICKNKFALKNRVVLEVLNKFANLFINKVSVYNLLTYKKKLFFKKRVVVVDSSSPNIGKLMHTGHFRSIIQGFFITNLFLLTGSYVLTNNHCGSWGSHAGLTTFYLRNQFKNNFFLINGLGEVSANYTKYSVIFNKYKSLYIKNKLNLQILHLYKKNTKNHSLWKNIFINSSVHFKNIFKGFNFKYDLNLGEYFYKDSVRLIKKTGLLNAKVNLGTYFVLKNNVKSYYSVVTLKTSKKNSSYLFFDLNNIYFQTQYNNVSFFVYVTDDRQVMHFVSLFQLLFKLNSGGPVAYLSTSNIFFGSICDLNRKPIKSRLGITRQDRLSSLVYSTRPCMNTSLELKKGWVSTSLSYSDLKTNRFSTLSNSNVDVVKSYLEVVYLRFFLLKIRAYTYKDIGVLLDLNTYFYIIKYLNESLYYLKLSFIKKNLKYLFTYVHEFSGISYKFFFKKKLIGYTRKSNLTLKEFFSRSIKKGYAVRLRSYLKVFNLIF
ncbi:MAG: arginine--tRNA ligase [Candidatus Organicella extenuata]|uniref:Arginine--tRNA ligase n=1 Tax=Candidatus Organicella extenuata TaxID=2841811 RepID=A0AA51GDU8_9BACT|nr:MAG: arginine--tRNA ligase [Candidatus Organicella extenuata]